MNRSLELSTLISDTFAGATRLIVPSLQYAALFVLSVAILFWGGTALPDGAGGSLAFIILLAASLFAHSVFSAAMYRELLPTRGGLARAAWKLSLAWLLIVVIAAIMATIIVLFFSLIGSSLGVVSGDSGQNITDMTAEMRTSGTFYPLFALFMLTLLGVFWFGVRMILFSAATASRGAVHVFRTWFWTKGYFLGLAIGVLLFLVLPLIFGHLLASALIGLIPVSVGSATHASLAAGGYALALLPAAWLAHSFTAAAMKAIAPSD